MNCRSPTPEQRRAQQPPAPQNGTPNGPSVYPRQITAQEAPHLLGQLILNAKSPQILGNLGPLANLVPMNYSPVPPQPCPPPPVPANQTFVVNDEEVGPPPPIERVHVGTQVDYWSSRLQCWRPSSITYVDPEVGDVKVDANPDALISLQDQQKKIRERKKPNTKQLEWIRSILREGMVETEGKRLFQKYCRPAPGSRQKVLSLHQARSLGAELDALFGYAGIHFKLVKQFNDCEDQTLGEDDFLTFFWEQLWGAHKEFAQSLRRNIAPKPPGHIDTVYTIIKTLGRGTYGVVELAEEKASRSKRAIKTLQRSSHQASESLDIEIENLRLLDHPHIVKMYEFCMDDNNFYIVMDFCSGGELGHTIRKRALTREYLPEIWVARVMQQLLMAIAHVHAHGIVHLDIKSANIMLMPEQRTLPPAKRNIMEPQANRFNSDACLDQPHVMLIDLGVAQIFKPGRFFNKNPCGTPATMAPEVWRGDITPKADIWSCGIVLFEMLALRLPFNPPVYVDEAIEYWTERPDLPIIHLVHHARQRTSEEAIAMIKSMVTGYRARPSASRVLTDRFLMRYINPSNCDISAAPREIAHHLAKFSKRNVLQKSVALAIARAWPANQLPTIKRIFQDIDTEGTGRLNKETLARALKDLGVDAAVARQAADAMDTDRDGKINWTEFVAACIRLGNENFDDDLRKLFQEVDRDGDGKLSEQDLAELLSSEHLDQDMVKEVLADLVGRSENDGQVDWAQFRKHFRSASVTENEVARISRLEQEEDEEEGAHHRNPSAGEMMAVGLVNAREMWDRANIWNRARETFFPSGYEDFVPDEESLKVLMDMGFSRHQCIEVLKKHHNHASTAAVEELLRCSA